MKIDTVLRGVVTVCLFLGALGFSATSLLAVAGHLGGHDVVPAAREPFTIVVIPDTQRYTSVAPEVFVGQTMWIRAKRDSRNILCVLHEGDITQHNTREEWIRADAAMSILDAEVPYCMAVGNHDMRPTEKGRDLTAFNEWFPLSRFASKAWFGGTKAAGIENAYYVFHAGDLRFLVLVLEFAPTDETLDWANRIVETHPSYRVIIVTHAYMNNDNTRLTGDDEYSASRSPFRGNDGETIWQRFVSRHPNIFLVLSGHVINPGVGRLTSVGDQGNRVHQLLANYSAGKTGRDGWFRLLEFVPEENVIHVRTYSAKVGGYSTRIADRFELQYGM